MLIDKANGLSGYGNGEPKIVNWPDALDRYADAVVGWNGESIVDAINSDSNDLYQPNGSQHDYRVIKRYSCG